MRWVLGSVAYAVALVGCGGEPLCGVDEESGEDRPICTFEIADVPEGLEFCTGDQWSDGCRSCGCENDGNVLCTETLCGESPAEE